MDNCAVMRVTCVATNTNSVGAACSVNIDGAVKCWGDGSYGQLGSGSALTNIGAPRLATVVSSVADVSTGNNYTCVKLNDNSAS